MTASLKADALDASAIAQAAQAEFFVESDGIVQIGWRREDVKVSVDGTPFPPAAGLGSWAAFKRTNREAMVMGDTVVFQDQVDAAFASNLEVTSLHNHFLRRAEGLFHAHFQRLSDEHGLEMIATTAGTHPGDQIDPRVIDLLKENRVLVEDHADSQRSHGVFKLTV